MADTLSSGGSGATRVRSNRIIRTIFFAYKTYSFAGIRFIFKEMIPSGSWNFPGMIWMSKTVQKDLFERQVWRRKFWGKKLKFSIAMSCWYDILNQR